MTNSIEEFFHKIEVKKGTKYSRLEITSSKDWLTPKKATYGTPLNTYSHIYKPVLYDYIFHRAKGRNIAITKLFKVTTFDIFIGPRYPWSDLWVRLSLTFSLQHLVADLTDVTLVDEDTNSIPTNNTNRTIQDNVAMPVTNPSGAIWRTTL